MRWARVVHLPFVAVALLVALALPAAPPAAAAPSGGTALEACRTRVGSVPTVGVHVCRTVQSITEGLGSACRRLSRDLGLEPPLRPVCELLDGRVVNPSEISAYEGSWTHRALGLQRSLDDGVGLTRSLLPHTHNSYNSSSYGATLTNQDPNQIYSLTDQLRMDIRAIELDVHWVPSIYGSAATGGKALTLCHGNTSTVPNVHVGCTNDRPLTQGLDELRQWMEAPGNTNEVVLLYLENKMDDDPVAHDLAASQIATHLGSLVARPAAGEPCAPVPTSTSRNALRAAGHRVLIVGNCGPGGWGTWVHDRATSTRWYESSSGPGDDYPGLVNGCVAERARTGAGVKITRWYDDSTAVAVATGGAQGTVSAAEAAAMVACGVNLVGFDQLKPDARLTSLVWSWAVDSPGAATGVPLCAYAGVDGRFRDDSCSTPRAFTCASSPSSWSVTTATGAWSDGASTCAAEYPGSSFAVPPNGWENSLLKTAAAGAETWLAYADTAGTGTWSVT